MELYNMSINEYLELLSSNAPAPGGGSAAALCGAQGVSLAIMVLSLTIGKEKYKEYESLCIDTKNQLTKIKKDFLDAMERDTKTFEVMENVFKMPKETEEDKKLRKEKMQEALKICTKTPLEMMQYANCALDYVQKIVGKSNQSACSDLGVSALNLQSAIQGAYLNVLINLSGIKDEEFVKENKNKANDYLNNALNVSKQIYEEVKNSL
ncbi:MAG: cyclodeaminase/cyclohydrolase family protein [Eubacteriales bacterium]|nr:cyclodeaminase/cyclohydrolase family protein [Eubacteriales bacterium]